MPIPYPPTNRLAVIGDRRTAAMVAADGSVNWMCLPNYNCPPIFGALLDASQGGYWRVGPEPLAFGQQSYVDDSAVLVTRWDVDGSILEVTDFMPWPEGNRSEDLQDRRALIRRVRAPAGPVNCVVEFSPRDDFQPVSAVATLADGLTLRVGEHQVHLWSSAPLGLEGAGPRWACSLEAGEEFWLVMETGDEKTHWDSQMAQAALEGTFGYWSRWSQRLTFTAPHRAKVMRSAKLVHLLSFAPAGSLVAAPTCSLPERIGGSSNYDYRYAWLRDASLSLASLGLLGDTQSAEPYMDWLTTLDSCIEAPLQPLYHIDGNPSVPEIKRPDIAGYRGSKPVLMGNDAYLQYQPDSYGYFAECALIYLKKGGKWKDSYSRLIKRLADHAANNWHRVSHGIWELPQERHYVSSKVMCWVTLDRATKIVQELDLSYDTGQWQTQMEQLHADVMTHGWSDELQSFTQAYDGDELDGSALLISVMEFLPGDHPHMLATLNAIEKSLTINGLVYRFDPQKTLGEDKPPLGEFEGAFLPVSFFMASALAKAGLTEKAEEIISSVEAVAGETGLIAEEMDPRNNEFLGNTPLIFSLVEYIRALMEIDKSRPLSKASLMMGQLKNKAERFVDG